MDESEQLKDKQRITQLEKENEYLRKELEELKENEKLFLEQLEETVMDSIPSYSVAIYSIRFNKNWSRKKISEIDRQLTAFCIAHCINFEIDADGTKHFPYSAWRFNRYWEV